MNRSSILVGVILAAILTFVIADLAGGWGTIPNEKWAAAISMICLAIWIGPGLLSRYSGNGGAALRAVALWLAIIVAIAVLYAFGKEFLVSIGVNVP